MQGITPSGYIAGLYDMSVQRLSYLFNKYSNGSLPEQEFSELQELWNTEANRTALDEQLRQTFGLYATHPAWTTGLKKEVWEQLRERIRTATSASPPPVSRVHFLRTAWFRYAAILLLIAGVATYLYVTSGPSSRRNPGVTKAQKAPDISPGGNKAILTLSDGSTILLDNAANGNLVNQGNTKIIKRDAGSLAYEAGDASDQVMYNIIATPNGGQYQVTLPDGTGVWLNAASSIKFPAAFAGKERKVEITGEVYMEVAQNKEHPFFVTAPQTTIEVLGTSFNIKAYENETFVKTTLAEGSIKIKVTNEELILQPAQQSSYNPATRKISVSTPDMDGVLAWRKGAFSFDKLGFEEIMRQLARWYNIDVIYEKGIPAIEFEGKMSRNVPLSDVLNFMEKAGVHFKMENQNKLIIMP